MIQSKQDEIMYWYKQILEQEKCGKSVLRFCERQGLPYKKFSNMKYRIRYSCQGDHVVYDEYVKHARELQKSAIPIGKFCSLHGVDKYRLGEMVTHLKYKDIIDNYVTPQESPKMNFIQVPVIPVSNGGSPVPVECEVMKKQNDVELIISSGVKVVVSPEVGADKLIRIIELLKDL